MSHNLTLLRPFDADLAGKGEQVCWEDGTPVDFICGPDKDDYICYSTDGCYRMQQSRMFRMQPIFWLDKKPVYPGDGLYSNICDYKFVVTKDESPSGYLWGDDANLHKFDSLSWPPVYREGWINIYELKGMEDNIVATTSDIFKTKEDADAMALPYRSVCLFVTWEVKP